MLRGLRLRGQSRDIALSKVRDLTRSALNERVHIFG